MGRGLRLVIAEAPGEVEAQRGLPLVGGSGSWLRGKELGSTNVWRGGMLGKAGIRDEDVSFVNCIQCQPPDNNFPTDSKSRRYISRQAAYDAVSHCYKAHVEPVLRARPWTRIDILGDKPLQFIAGKSDGISKWRGSPLPIPALGPNPITVPTFHPAYIMRNQVYYPVAVNDLRKTLEVPPEHYNLRPSLEDVQNFTATTFAFDIETPKYREMGEHAPIEMIGLSDSNYHAIVAPCRGAYLVELKRIFRNAKAVISQNGTQFDLPQLKEKLGVTISADCQEWDIMLMHHLLFPDYEHDLGFIGSQLTNHPAWKDDKSEFERYCARDTAITFECWQVLLPMLRREKMEDLYNLVSIPLGRICYLMHKTGIKIDPNNIGKVRAEILAEIKQKELLLPEQMRTYSKPCNKNEKAPPGYINPKTGKPGKIIKIASTKEVVPWNSPLVRQKFLYGTEEPWQLGLEVQLNEEGNPTTGKQALDKLYGRTKNAAILALRQLGTLSELESTFCKQELLKVDRHHPHFNVHGTSQARLSSSNPNLQNCPESARYIYVPSHAGWKLIDCVTPLTRILKADLTWDEARNINIGDELIGFDEEQREGVYGRRLRKSCVTNVRKIQKHCYRLITDQGTLVVSGNHSFLKKNSNNGSNYEWGKAVDLKVGDKLAFLFKPWQTDFSYDAGWLAGFFDGEGYVHSGTQFGFGQNPGQALEKAKRLLLERGFSCNESGKSKCRKMFVTDDKAFSAFRLLGSIRPCRLLPKLKFEGSKFWGRKSEPATVNKIEFVNVQDVIAIETTTHTLIAEGFLSHNCDFSQIENRLTAFFAGDKERLKRFDTIKDFSEHKFAASRFLGIPYDAVVKDNSKDAPYGKAKRIVHLTNYGGGALKIAKINDMDFKETKQIQEVWKAEIKATIDWQTRTAEQAKRQGWLRNPFGRKRDFFTSAYFCESLSFIPQSTAAEIILRVMIALMYERVGWPEDKVKKVVQVYHPLPMPARLLLQVHDSLVLECPSEQVEEVVRILYKVMMQPWPELNGFSIPISVKVGDDWGSAKDYVLSYETAAAA